MTAKVMTPMDSKRRSHRKPLRKVVPYEAARVHELRPHAGGVVLNISSNCLSFDDACRAVAACK